MLWEPDPEKWTPVFGKTILRLKKPEPAGTARAGRNIFRIRHNSGQNLPHPARAAPF
jgi:hypothetical protein